MLVEAVERFQLFPQFHRDKRLQGISLEIRREMHANGLLIVVLLSKSVFVCRVNYLLGHNSCARKGDEEWSMQDDK